MTPGVTARTAVTPGGRSRRHIAGFAASRPGAHEPEHPHEGKPGRDAEHAHGERPHGEEPHGKRPHGEESRAGSHAHDEPAHGPETTDAPSPTRARDRGPTRRPSHAPEDPARVLRTRKALHEATDFLERLAHLQPAREVGREARNKAIAKVRAAHVPGTRPYREVEIEAREAGRVAWEKAVTEERDRQADLVEELLDIAEVAELHIPTDQMTVIPVLIRTGRYVVPYLRTLASSARSDPRAALRQFFDGLRHS